ncbi:MAG: MTH1187 family thiamine-binding protein [Syntrophaceae bacterium]|nr:MTH1187 family thiamine-binding protein [Syntrophaceae bacterium]
MLVQFSIVPLGRGESISEHVARVLDLVDGSGLPYRLTPMGTIVEGEWDEVMALIGACHREALRGAPRALTTIIIDDRPGKADRITEKIRSVEKRLGRELRK